MLPQKDGLSLSPAKVFSIFIFHLLIHLNRAESQVVGPHQPVVALVDDDVILPCHVEPAEDVTAEILEWTRSDLNPRFVHVWRSGQDLVNTRNPSYRGRSSLFINELKRGNISLKLSRVKLSDEGTYECSIPLMEKKSFVKLVVASDAATSPVISLSGIDKNRGGVVLQCESAGWYPEPELLWLDGEGNLLSAGPTETLRGPDDLYTISSRVTVEKRHSNNITCRVQQKKISQNRETHIHVPEDFFEVPSSSPSVIIGLAVSLALCIMLLISSAAVLLCRMKKHKNNRSPEDQTDGEGADVPLRKTEREKQNTSSSSPKTKNKTSCWPITWTSKLPEEQKRREEAEKNLQDIKEEMINSKLEKADFIQKRMQTFLTMDSELQLEKNTEIIDQLQQVKEASEKLKNQLEDKNPEMSKSETELDEIIQRLMQTFPTLESKLSGNISQAQKEKQEMEREMERLRNELDSTKQQLQQEKKKAAEDLEEKNRELSGNISQAQKEKQEMEREMERLRNELDSTKQQLQQQKEKAEKLKNQFKSKCHEMINSEREKDEIIKTLMETFPTLESKLEKKTEIIKQLKQVKDTVEKLKKELEKKNPEMFKSEEEMDKIIQTDMQRFLTKMFKSEMEKDGIIQKMLQTLDSKDRWNIEELKAAAELLKAELENKSQKMIKSEKEKDEIIQKLMKTFPALDSKWRKNTDIIKQLVQVKQKAEDLKKQLQLQTHESEEKTETIRQLQQLEQAAEILKIQLESKNQQMIKSEREKDEFIQKQMAMFPTLDSKWKENTKIINQLQEVKETAEKLKQLEKKNQEFQGKTDSEIINQLQQDKETAKKLEQLQLQGKTDSEIIKQLQQDKKTAEKLKQLQFQAETESKIIDQLQEVKDTAENLKKQMESQNWEMLQAEKRKNDESDRKLKELVKQLQHEKKKTEKNLNELVKQL